MYWYLPFFIIFLNTDILQSLYPVKSKMAAKADNGI